MLGFSPLASEALADSGGQSSITVISSSSVSISGIRVVDRAVSVSSNSTVTAIRFRLVERTASVSGVSTVNAVKISLCKYFPQRNNHKQSLDSNPRLCYTQHVKEGQRLNYSHRRTKPYPAYT